MGNFMLQLMLDLVFYPKGRQHLLSYLPSQHSGWVIGAYFAYEATVFFLFICVNLFEFSAQVYFIKSLIRWSQLVGPIDGEPEVLQNTVGTLISNTEESRFYVEGSTDCME